MNGKMNNNAYEIYAVHIDESIDLPEYLELFSSEIRNHILSYRNHSDKLIAFASALLKYYYLPSLLGLSRQDLVIKEDVYGKPYLVGFPEIDFNISHSGKYVVLGIAYGKKIGIDIEQINHKIDLDLGQFVFSSYEHAQINSVYDFYRLWVKKEAYLKCQGKGFATDLYQNTRLNTKLTETNQSHEIYVNSLAQDYVLAVCVTI